MHPKNSIAADVFLALFFWGNFGPLVGVKDCDIRMHLLCYDIVSTKKRTSFCPTINLRHSFDTEEAANGSEIISNRLGPKAKVWRLHRLIGKKGVPW